jgi:hypothetical protein
MHGDERRRRLGWIGAGEVADAKQAVVLVGDDRIGARRPPDSPS